jgi:flagellar biogenesis protein FliO
MQRARRRQPKRLRLCESLPLGERRFVAVVEFERSRFLIGGTQGSLVLLAPLRGADETTAGENENRNQNKQDLKIWQRSRNAGTKASAAPGGRP